MPSILIWVIAAAVLGGCVAAKLPDEMYVSESITLQKAQEDAIRSAVLARLKDPESARFGEIKAGVNSNGKILACGLVNSKNSYGGYTGMQPYSVEMLGETVTIQGPSELLANLCERQGLMPR